MSAQIDTLTSKVDGTWEDSVEDQMRDEGDFWMDENFKCDRYNEYFHHAKRVFSLELEGKLSEAFYAHAITIADKDFNCTQCDATLEIKKDVFNAQYVDCQYCNTVNTFTPETKFAQIGWTIINNMAAYRALDEFKALDKIDQTITALNSNRRGADEELDNAHRAREQAIKAYIRKVCENKAELIPSKADELEDNIKALETQWGV